MSRVFTIFLLFFLGSSLHAQSNIEEFYDSSGIKRQIRGHFNPDVDRNHTEWAPSIVEFVFSKTDDLPAILKVIEADLEKILIQYQGLRATTTCTKDQIQQLQDVYQLDEESLIELGLVRRGRDGSLQAEPISEFERRFVPLWLAFNQAFEAREAKENAGRLRWTIVSAGIGALIGAGIGVGLQLHRGHLKSRPWIVRSVVYAGIGAGICGTVYRTVVDPAPQSLRLEYRSPSQLPAERVDQQP